MLGRFDELNKAREFHLVCNLDNGESVTMKFSHHRDGSLHIDTGFFGKNGSLEVTNSFEVIMNISLSLPTVLKLDNSGYGINIKPGTILKIF